MTLVPGKAGINIQGIPKLWGACLHEFTTVLGEEVTEMVGQSPNTLNNVAGCHSIETLH